MTKGKTTKKLAPIDNGGGSPGMPTGALTTGKMTGTSNKKELVEAVRMLNPAGLNSAPNIFWDVEGSLKNTNMDNSGVKQQVVIVENGVLYSIKRYNDLRVSTDRLTKVLKSKLDELDDQKKAFETLDAMKNATTEEGLRIKSLQQEAKDLRTEIEKKEHYTRVLEHMLLRLKHNALKFDAHMTGMEETHKNITKEGNEIRLLRRDLDAGLAKAVKVLEETTENLQTARTDRKVLLEQRSNELKTARTLANWMKDREMQKLSLAMELKGDLTRDEEFFLKDKLSERVETTKNLQKLTEESHKRLQDMEDAFLQLKQVTGVSSVDEMYEKFTNQKNSKKALEIDVADAEARLAKAKKDYAKKEQHFQELKASGGGLAELSRETIQGMEESIEAKRAESKLVKTDTDRLGTLLMALQQGSMGLLQRVSPHIHLSDGNVFELTETEDKQAWVQAMDALSTAEGVLAKMMETLSGDGTGSPTNMRGLLDDDEKSTNSDEAQSVGTVVEAPLFANNVRIKSKKSLREDDHDFTRTDTGRATGQETTGSRVVAHEYSALDTEPSLSGASKTRDQKADGDDNEPVASRKSVKHVSHSRTTAHNRKLEMEERRKKLKETMANQNSDDAALANKAKLLQQKQMALRLSTFPAPVTLPEGITLRDDAMTKTTAFLTKMPKLV